MTQSSENSLSRLELGWRVLRELGPLPLIHFARYQIVLHSGYFHWRTTKPVSDLLPDLPFKPIILLPEAGQLRQVIGEMGIERLRSEADEIVAGQVRLFGDRPTQLQLSPAVPLFHWTVYELGKAQSSLDEDIKFTWEPARFTWAYTLGRAYRILGDERYPQAFWEFFETFQTTNPAYLGPNWTSAQEAALRLLALIFSLHLFQGSPHSTPKRIRQLCQAVADHAGRIPPTLSYARAQNNNHLLSEAAALFSAACLLGEHPQAAHWRKLGWEWFNRGIQSQIAPDGAYVQHSTNYHRLVLQLGLWFDMLAKQDGRVLPDLTRQRLAAATRWLLALTDPRSGKTPNLGPNDGAYIQPLTSLPFSDHRAVLQAAGRAFLEHQNPFPPGEWDEASLWYGLSFGDHELEAPDQNIPGSNHQPESERQAQLPGRLLLSALQGPAILHNPANDSWAYLRAARFKSRPGHADQLHLDLWWRGVNLALDAGTYLYNAPPPWDNALMSASVHNTVTLAPMTQEQQASGFSIHWQDQMRRAGRFLYLEWAQAEIVESEQDPAGNWQRLVACHKGYQRLGVIHKRAVTALEESGWLVEDVLLPASERPASHEISLRPEAGSQEHAQGNQLFAARLHWLLPDWPWRLADDRLSLQSPDGWVQLSFNAGAGVAASQPDLTIVRAGERLVGSGQVKPIYGWYSPTYGVKLPVLSLSIVQVGSLPIRFSTRWQFPVELAT